MTRKIPGSGMGRSDLGWLKSLFHFSFADYRNPENVRFGVLRVINDDLVLDGTGFDWHPHHDMEIISYILQGQVTHGDNMGNENTIGRGDVQYMSAGTGVMHKEYNFSGETARFLQIWIFPDQKGLRPQYGDKRFTREQRHNQWLHIVSSPEGGAPIRIHQDANIHVAELDAGKSLSLDIAPDRQAYLVQIEGEGQVNEHQLGARDALESVGQSLNIQAKTDSHYLVIDVKKAG